MEPSVQSVKFGDLMGECFQAIVLSKQNLCLSCIAYAGCVQKFSSGAWHNLNLIRFPDEE